MNNKNIMSIFIFIFLFQYVLGIFLSFNGTNVEHIVSNLEKLSNDCVELRKIKVNYLKNFLKINSEIKKINHYQFDSKKNIFFFNEKNLILFHIESFNKKINNFEIVFMKIKNTLFFEILMLNDIYDFNTHFQNINYFLTNYKEKTKNYLTNLDIFDSKIYYETYIKEIELIKFKDVLKHLFHDLNSCQNCFNGQFDKKISLILNKKSIIAKINEIRNNFKFNKLDKIIFNYTKSDINDLIIENTETKNKNFIIEKKTIKLIENKNMIIKFYDIMLNMNELERLAKNINYNLKISNNVKTEKVKSEIILYQNTVYDFLNNLNSFFLIFNNIKTKNGIISRDYGVLIFLNYLKSILFDEKNFESNINYVFNDLLINDKLENYVFKNIKNYCNKFNEYSSIKAEINIINDIQSYIELNEYILSSKVELNFKEILSYELNDKLFKFYNLNNLILKYFNTNYKKELQFEILKECIEILNDEYNNFNLNFNLIKLLDSIDKISKIQNFEVSRFYNFDLDMSDIFFLKIVFDTYFTIKKIFIEKYFNIVQYLKKDNDMSISLIKFFYFIFLLQNINIY